VAIDRRQSRLRGAVIGLGMIGRHHARLLQDSDRVEFAGAVDPGGDRYRSVHDRELVFDSVIALLDRGAVDFAIVSVPTSSYRQSTAFMTFAKLQSMEWSQRTVRPRREESSKFEDPSSDFLWFL